jgi:hypothetical protein
MVGLVHRHPLVAFSVLAYTLSWWGWPLYAAGLSPAPVVGFGPFLAALVVLALTHGRAGVGTLLRRVVRWRVGPGWYAVALLLPVAVTGAAAGPVAPAPAVRAGDGAGRQVALRRLRHGHGGAVLAYRSPAYRTPPGEPHRRCVR